MSEKAKFTIEPPPWAYAGFERDGKFLLLSASEKYISYEEFRRCLRMVGVPLDPEVRPSTLTRPPALQRPQMPTMQDEWVEVDGETDFVVNVNTGEIVQISTNTVVGYADPADIEMVNNDEPEEPVAEPIGPPPDDDDEPEAAEADEDEFPEGDEQDLTDEQPVTAAKN